MREITQQELTALYQSHKNIYSRIDLYQLFPNENADDKFLKVAEVTGVVKSGTVTQDADSDIRRTASLEMYVKDSSFVVSSEVKIWVDKFLRLYIGYPSQITGEMFWYDQGFYVMQTASYSYSADDRSLTLSLADMTAMLDGSIAGQLTGYSGNVTIEAGAQTISAAMRAIVKDQGGWPYVEIDSIAPYAYEGILQHELMPYTLELPCGASVMDVVKELRDLYPGYETFFDLDGTFRCRRIPSHLYDPVIMTNAQLKPLVVQESNNRVDFSTVKNVVQVFGADYEEVEHYSDDVTNDGDTYIVTYESFTADAINDDTVFSFLPNRTNTGPVTLQINDLDPVSVVISSSDLGDREIPEGLIQVNQPIIVRYERPTNSEARRFVYLGRTYVQGIAVLVDEEPKWIDGDIGIKQDMLEWNCHNVKYVVDPDSPFTVEKIGKRALVLSGTDYDGIESDELALERAWYELWSTTNMASDMTLETILIPWLEVNQKIGYNSAYDEMQAHEQGEEIDQDNTNQYIIKSINISFDSGTMTMDLKRFYNTYPFTDRSTLIHTS